MGDIITQNLLARIKSSRALIDILLTSKTCMRSSPNENPIYVIFDLTLLFVSNVLEIFKYYIWDFYVYQI